MPGFSILKLFTLFGIVSTWSQKALEDGKITLAEAAELVESLGPLLGVPVELQVPVLSNPELKTPGLKETLQPVLEGVDELPPGDRPHPRN